MEILTHNKTTFWFCTMIDRKRIAFDLYIFARGFNIELRLPDLFWVGDKDGNRFHPFNFVCGSWR